MGNLISDDYYLTTRFAPLLATINYSILNFSYTSSFSSFISASYRLPIMEVTSFQAKFSRFVKKNVVMIIMLPVIGGIHWGWLKLQEIEKFVSKEQKRELPIIEGATFVKDKVVKIVQPSES